MSPRAQSRGEHIPNVRSYYVYMLLCVDGRYYVGVTNNVDRRFAEHADGADPDAWTFHRRPVQLVYVQPFQQVQEAIAWEKQLKRWSSAKKRALAANNFDALKDLAKCRNNSRHDRPERQHALGPNEHGGGEMGASTALGVTER